MRQRFPAHLEAGVFAVSNVSLFREALRLDINQLKEDYVTKDTNMGKYSEKARKLLQRLEEMGGH